MLNLAVTLAPCLVQPAFARPAWPLVLFALGLTALFLADAQPARRLLPRADTPADAAALRWAQVTGLAVLLAFWVGLAEGRATNVRMAFLGTIVMFAGAALRWLAVRTLGDDFVSEVTPRPGQRLVTGGVYRWLRHPSEWGLLGAMLGAALARQSAGLLWITTVVVFPLSVLRVRLEEAELRRVYGGLRLPAGALRTVAPPVF